MDLHGVQVAWYIIIITIIILLGKKDVQLVSFHSVLRLLVGFWSSGFTVKSTHDSYRVPKFGFLFPYQVVHNCLHNSHSPTCRSTHNFLRSFFKIQHLGCLIICQVSVCCKDRCSARTAEGSSVPVPQFHLCQGGHVHPATSHPMLGTGDLKKSYYCALAVIKYSAQTNLGKRVYFASPFQRVHVHRGKEGTEVGAGNDRPQDAENR